MARYGDEAEVGEHAVELHVGLHGWPALEQLDLRAQQADEEAAHPEEWLAVPDIDELAALLHEAQSQCGEVGDELDDGGVDVGGHLPW